MQTVYEASNLQSMSLRALQVSLGGAISTIHFWKADILRFMKNPGGRVEAVA